MSRPDWCPEETWEKAFEVMCGGGSEAGFRERNGNNALPMVARCARALIAARRERQGEIARLNTVIERMQRTMSSQAQQWSRSMSAARREGMEELGADISERLRLRSLAINEALVEQRDIDAAVLMSCDLPNIPAAAIRAKINEAPE